MRETKLRIFLPGANYIVYGIEDLQKTFSDPLQVILDIAMYSTGKKDIAGKLIYEGDLVKPLKGKLQQIVWIDSRYYCGWYFKELNGKLVNTANFDWEQLRVVGNIWEDTIVKYN